jgi:hypothetical protein
MPIIFFLDLARDLQPFRACSLAFGGDAPEERQRAAGGSGIDE